MENYTSTRIWRINHKLVIADTIEEAIELYKLWVNSLPISEATEIVEIKAIGDNQIPEQYNAIIKK